MKIMKRYSEEIVPDSQKIAAAVTKALDLIAGMTEAIAEIGEDLERDFFTALHSFAHWILRHFASAVKKVRKRLHPAANGAVCLVFAVSACVRILSQAAGVVSCKSRSAYLLRTQDRASGDSDSELRRAPTAA